LYSKIDDATFELFTADIIDVMMENDVEPDGLIGSSEGAALVETTSQGSQVKPSAITCDLQ